MVTVTSAVSGVRGATVTTMVVVLAAVTA
jgi:hypothetical protein